MQNWKDRVKDAASKTAEVAEKAKEQYDAHQQQKAATSRDVGTPGEQPLLTVVSHDQGKNAIVSLYLDRIERVKERSAISISRANQDAEVIPLGRVSHVRAEKKGFRTNVTVTVGAEDIVFRVSHDEASTFKDAITKLILHKEAGSGPDAGRTSEPDMVDQIRRLGELRDQGLITAEEFEAKKTQLLGL
jgi:hypothetical protein